MKLGHTNDEIKFDGVTAEGATRFLLILDGEPTMRILCVHADPEKTIHIGRADGTNYQATKGRFKMVTKLTEDADGLPLGAEERVDRISVYGYILPRVHVMLGRLLRASA
jgi:hypothetical protein